ncbi:FbpB family small basic protein [Bacillus sp. HMF5848]|nr:FbpB family small basic protein [Bacillus sp. HMF5848]RSK27141.1 FbpB family small basic protein [Bacillus sp. HMF5848]
MRRIRKRTFEELINENKKQLLKDQAALERLEARLEEKMVKKAE